MYIILADSGDSLMKFVFIGIIIFIGSLGHILKWLGFDDSKAEGSAKPKNPRQNNEDMEMARRRLREMMSERDSLNPSFPKAPKPVLFEESVFADTVFEESIPPEPVFKESIPVEKPKVQVEDKSSAYHQNAFDYNSALAESEKLLAESMIAYEKVAKNDNLKPISADEIKGNEISDFVHNKKFLKKSIVISEILDKPLSLR